MTELKPCPFCGHKAIIDHSELKYCNGNCAESIRGLYSTTWKVHCSYCSIAKVERTSYYRFANNEELVVLDKTLSSNNDGRKEAIEAWNRRAGEEEGVI